jgi:Lon protease-like protein
MAGLPGVIPLFPLPNAVLFPHIPLPLHVFEPRYRAMVRDAAAGARLIGMTLLRGDWQADYHGRPEIFAVGTVGEMMHVEPLADGRFNVLLRGLREFTITRELPGGDYRRAEVAWRPPDAGGLLPETREEIVRLLERYLAGRGVGPGRREVRGEGVGDEAYVNFVAQHLDGEPLEKQALLEASPLASRAQCLLEVLRFRLRAAEGGGDDSGTLH